jgi:hypothetical protein
MGEVRQFPTTKVEAEQLEEMTQELEAMYKALEAAHGLINELELQCAELEANYDAKFAKHVEVVGVENVSVHLLNYCTQAEDHIYGQKD